MKSKAISSQENTPTSLQSPGLGLAAQRSKESDARLTGRQLTQIPKLKESVAARDETIAGLQTELKNLSESHQVAIEKLIGVHQAKEASFTESAQQWKNERETFEHELQRIQETFVQEKERYTICLQRSIDSGRDKKVLQDALEDQAKAHYKKTERLESKYQVQLNELYVKENETKKQLETANKELSELKKSRDDEIAALKAKLEQKQTETVRSTLTESAHKHREDIATHQELAKKMEIEYLAKLKEKPKLQSDDGSTIMKHLSSDDEIQQEAVEEPKHGASPVSCFY